MRPSRKSIDRLKVLWLGSKDQTHAEERNSSSSSKPGSRRSRSRGRIQGSENFSLRKGLVHFSTSHDDHNDCRQSVVLPYNTGPTHLNFILDVDCTLVSKHIDRYLPSQHNFALILMGCYWSVRLSVLALQQRQGKRNFESKMFMYVMNVGNIWPLKIGQKSYKKYFKLF